MDFAGADASFGVVIGVPSEAHHVKKGVSYDEFIKTMRDKITAKLDYGHQLLPSFNDLVDPLSIYEDMPDEQISITNDTKRMMVWKLDMTESSKAKKKLGNDLKTTYISIWGQCTRTLQGVIQSDPLWEVRSNERNAL